MANGDQNISDQRPKLYLFDSLNRKTCGGDVLGFWGKAPATKRFPGYYRGLHERWIREIRCYFFCQAQKWEYSTPAPKSGGYAYPPYLPVNYAYAESLWRLGNDDSYSHNFSSDGREFWDGPLAPSVSATVTNATFSTLNKPTRLFPAREHQRYLASTRLRVM